jgi:hypothetical protein
MRASSVPSPLADDVQAVLNLAPGIEVGTSIPEPRFVVEMTRSQAEALQRWLNGLLEGLSANNERRLTCLQCIGRIAIAIRLSEIESE